MKNTQQAPEVFSDSNPNEIFALVKHWHKNLMTIGNEPHQREMKALADKFVDDSYRILFPENL